MILKVGFALNLSNYTSLKRFICLKWILKMSQQCYILSSTIIHCRSLPFNTQYLIEVKVRTNACYMLFNISILPIVTSHTYCSTIICYLLVTCYQSHLLSTSLAIPVFAINLLDICFAYSRPHLRSGLTCSHHTCSPASLAFRSICFQVSLALATLALQPHLLSGQFIIRSHLLSPHLLSSLTCFQVNLLSGLTWSCHTCSPASCLLSGQCVIRSHLLSKRLLSSLNCYQSSSAIQKCSYYLNTLLSKLVVF